MSWRSWNDSLTNLKGQITTFANNVLADTEESSQGKFTLISSFHKVENSKNCSEIF